MNTQLEESTVTIKITNALSIIQSPWTSERRLGISAEYGTHVCWSYKLSLDDVDFEKTAQKAK